MKYWHTEKLNTRLDYLLKQIVTCQSLYRGRKARQEYKFLQQRGWQQLQLANEFLGHIEVFSEMLSRTLVKMEQQDRERHEAKKRQVRLNFFILFFFLLQHLIFCDGLPDSIDCNLSCGDCGL